MAQNSIIDDESVEFNTDDENINGDFLMDDSPTYPEDPAEDILPPTTKHSGFDAIPMDDVPPPPPPPKPQPKPEPKPNTGFQAIPMQQTPKPAPEPKASGGSRLLRKKTIDKAVDTAPVTAEPSVFIPDQFSSNSENMDFMNNDEPKLPPPSELTSQIGPPPSIPPIPKKMPIQKSPPIELASKIEGGSSTGTSFDLFTKLPPVPPPGGAKEPALPFPVAQSGSKPFIPSSGAQPQRPVLRSASQQKLHILQQKSSIPDPEPFIPAQPSDPEPLMQNPFIPSQPSKQELVAKPFIPVTQQTDAAPFIPAVPSEPEPLVPVKQVSKPFIPAKPVDPAPFIPAQQTPFIPSKPVDPAPFIPQQPVDPAPFIPSKPVDPTPFIPAKSVDPAPFIPSKPVDPAPFIPAQQTPFIPDRTAPQTIPANTIPQKTPFIPTKPADTVPLVPAQKVPFVPVQPVPQSIPVQTMPQQPVVQVPVQSAPNPAATVVPVPVVPVPQSATPVPLPVYQPPSPTYVVERGFASSLDRSLSSFKRIFANEFSSMIRSPSPNPALSIDFDEFSESLTAEIGQIIETPIPAPELNLHQLARKISTAIEEHTRPMTAILADAETRNSAAAKHHLSELKRLQHEVDNLRSMFKTNTESIIGELEREKQNTISLRESEQTYIQKLESKMRSIKLKHVELETRAHHQNTERENIDRLSKQHMQRKREWEDNALIQDYDEGSSLRRRIIQEISVLKEETGQDSFINLNKIVEDGLRVVKEESDNMKNELISLEMANRWVIAKLQQVQAARPPAPLQRRSVSGKSALLSEAQFRVDQLRRQRQHTVRDITNNIH